MLRRCQPRPGSSSMLCRAVCTTQQGQRPGRPGRRCRHDTRRRTATPEATRGAGGCLGGTVRSNQWRCMVIGSPRDPKCGRADQDRRRRRYTLDRMAVRRDRGAVPALDDGVHDVERPALRVAVRADDVLAQHGQANELDVPQRQEAQRRPHPALHGHDAAPPRAGRRRRQAAKLSPASVPGQQGDGQRRQGREGGDGVEGQS